jgi:hypothetical protein
MSEILAAAISTIWPAVPSVDYIGTMLRHFAYFGR